MEIFNTKLSYLNQRAEITGCPINNHGCWEIHDEWENHDWYAFEEKHQQWSFLAGHTNSICTQMDGQCECCAREHW